MRVVWWNPEAEKALGPPRMINQKAEKMGYFELLAVQTATLLLLLLPVAEIREMHLMA